MAGLTTVLKKNSSRKITPQTRRACNCYLHLISVLSPHVWVPVAQRARALVAQEWLPVVPQVRVDQEGLPGTAEVWRSVDETGLLAPSPRNPEVREAELESSQRQPCGSQSVLGCQVADALTSMPRWPNTLLPRP